MILLNMNERKFMYSKIENRYNVIYPDNINATYQSLMNYSDDLERVYQRWYRYKEGYSLKLVENLINEYSRNGSGIILDPFLGSGSTIVAANKLGYKGIGFEVNPFSYFLSSRKLYNYNNNEILDFKAASDDLVAGGFNNYEEADLPILSTSTKIFNTDVKEIMMKMKSYINNVSDETTRELLLLGWLSIIEGVSNYRKAGNGLKKRKYVKPRIITKEAVIQNISKVYSAIIEDISSSPINFEKKIYNVSSLQMNEYVEGDSIEGVIFSPPYANCFDYTEIYKLELWFGEFVNEYSDLKKLREKSLRSHLNGLKKFDVGEKERDIASDFIDMIDEESLWSKKIPIMLRGYFDDMKEIISQSYSLLRKDGFCNIIVGNSSYGGVIIPTDLILAEYASGIGFEVDKIEIDRFIITSSQQYHITKELGKYLRESVICLRKK